ncbi:tRNA (adenosine(37)-N6)-dimethylallyltransferase MiaA [Flavobacterium sp. MAH-1]|uniref:tRNA dimethylallyltransferase n=1 Tax=Flavobacterium agri TaxID=2743471 RepID=A0A7Y9C8E3_9FLAO|nr:tRNA (adenosine(37)-N6)-dimethylallyltransferase MiaA [Flavobacterium agri]NUY82278.1 tRNA (adenosine(37)-N6)-dimethylallyltransferase MiaA [Flavobacterium agri]NYA72302.1 tRNA (adenosine(37)-N6)-dimethylallyltransferase MiaA [Flavobacterium agri]
MKYLIIIIGPTAIGKTALSIQLAHAFDCEIISCDSRQFFKEMTIGTAVPDAEELAAAQHHFIHNKSIFEEYTVGDFEKEALAKLDELFQRRDFVIMVGGSGLYVDAVLKGFDEFPEIDASVREKITSEYEAKGIGYLQSQVEKLDPVYFSQVDTQNPQRLMRALEVCLGTGKPYSSFRKQKTNKRGFTPVVIGLDAPRDIIYDRINKRVDVMVSEGLVEEARNLHPHKNLNALQTVGYRELFDYFEGKISLDFAIEEIKKNTRRFAKRQLTWFRRNELATWFDAGKHEEIVNFIKKKAI